MVNFFLLWGRWCCSFGQYRVRIGGGSYIWRFLAQVLLDISGSHCQRCCICRVLGVVSIMSPRGSCISRFFCRPVNPAVPFLPIPTSKGRQPQLYTPNGTSVITHDKLKMLPANRLWVQGLEILGFYNQMPCLPNVILVYLHKACLSGNPRHRAHEILLYPEIRRKEPYGTNDTESRREPRSRAQCSLLHEF